MLGFIYLLAAAGATANQEPVFVAVPPPAPTIFTSATSSDSMAEIPRVLVGKEQRAAPLNNQYDWVNTDDYPKLALAAERSGTTAFRLQIDPTGRVSNCEVTQSSGHVDLDAATCAHITQRAVFSPALDRKGKATFDSYVNRVRWQIPGSDFPTLAIITGAFPHGPEIADYSQLEIADNDYPAIAKANLQAGQTVFQLTVASSGDVEKCHIISSSGFADLDMQSCAIATKWMFKPAMDFEGMPTKGRITHQIFWQLPDNNKTDRPEYLASRTNAFETEGAIILAVDIDETGKATNCSAKQTGQISFLSQSSNVSSEYCKMFARAKIKPFRNPKGQFVKRRVVVKFSIELENVTTAVSVEPATGQ